MKALTVLQPWATALLGPKDVENRTWRLPTEYFGQPIALHSSLRYSKDEYNAFAAVSAQAGLDIYDMSHIIRQGENTAWCIIGVIWFSGWVKSPLGDDRQFSPWQVIGMHAWVKQNVITLPTPIPCKGALGLWTVPAAIEAQIRAQIGEVK